jgi:hypothetical protein
MLDGRDLTSLIVAAREADSNVGVSTTTNNNNSDLSGAPLNGSGSEYADASATVAHTVARPPPPPTTTTTSSSTSSKQCPTEANPDAGARSGRPETAGFRVRDLDTVLLNVDPFMEGAAVRRGQWKLLARPRDVINGGWSFPIGGGMDYRPVKQDSGSEGEPVWELCVLETILRDCTCMCVRPCVHERCVSARTCPCVLRACG